MPEEALKVKQHEINGSWRKKRNRDMPGGSEDFIRKHGKHGKHGKHVDMSRRQESSGMKEKLCWLEAYLLRK